MRCLGHCLTSNGSIVEDFQDAVKNVWGAWHSNVSAGLFQAPPVARMRFLNRCVKPMIAFKWSRWPYSESLENKLNQLHRHLISSCLRIPPAAHETPDDYHKRVSSAAGRIASQTGRWSDSWRSALVSWNGHVQRAHDPGSWSGPVADWHDLYWLLEQRVANGSQGSFARTRTRAARGPPSKRWAEGYDVLERKL